MSSIDSIANPLIDPAISRSLVPVEPVRQTGQHNDDPAPRQQPVVIGVNQRNDLQDRAALLHQKSGMSDGSNARSRHAIGAYRALGNSEERERISSLLGVDEYA